MGFDWRRPLRSLFPGPRTWKDEAREHGLFPILGTWEEYYVLDSAGRLLFVVDDWSDAREETDPRMRHVILAQAALRYPELEALRPVRGPDDPDCALCGGTGTWPELPKQICACGGLGWVPAGLASGDTIP